MPKSNVKWKENYKRKYDALNKKYEEECQKNNKWKNNYEEIHQENIRLKNSHDDMFKKNVKHVEINSLFHNAEKKWRGENIYLRQENNLEVSKVIKLRKSLEDKDKEINDLKKEIEHLKEQLQRKEMEEIKRMKEEIPSDF